MSYHHGRLRDSLVEAALGLARSGGPEAVVLRAVSREAGVSHNAAYRHFADHQELLGAVSQRCMEELAALMQERMRAIRARDPVKRALGRINATGRAYIEFARTEPGWFRTAFSTAHPPTPSGPEADAGKGADGAADDGPDEGPYGILSACLDDLVAVGVLPAERRPRAEYAAWSMVHGLSSLLVDGPLRAIPDAETDAAISTVLAVVQRGL